MSDDFDALADSFDAAGVLRAENGRVEAQSGEQIARLATEIPASYSQVAAPRHNEKEQPMTDGTTQTLDAVAVHSGEGEARWWFGQLAEIKATAADTGGQFTIIEVTCAPGFEAPLHVHHREDEAFWILDGDVTLYVGEDTIEAAAGDYAFGPRDIPHRYTVGENGCRMLFICTPGGFEGLVLDMSEPAASRTIPLPAGQPPDLEQIEAIANKHGCELLF
jgi:quercetin dioxygenase-like cupin family protein